MNVLVTVPFKEEHMERIRAAAGEGATVTQLLVKPNSPDQSALREALADAEVVIGEPKLRLLMTPDLPLKWIQMTWAGTDIYTASGAPFPEGVMLTNVAGKAYGHIISQYVVGQILALTQNLFDYARQQPTEKWRDLGPNISLEGAHVLVFGAGDIGQHVAKRLQGFDIAKIVGVCRDTEKPRPYFDELITLTTAEMRLPEFDVVVCCMPRADSTVRYLNERRLMRMKEGAVLVNVGRGNFIDCDALYRVLGTGRLRGAALDVTDPEPLPLHHPLWRHPQCIITPHIAGGAFGHSEGTEERICQICCANLEHYRRGEPLEHRVL